MCQCSGVSFQIEDPPDYFPDTRNLTPETYKLCYCCPAGATFSERSLGKSLVPYKNPSTPKRRRNYEQKLVRKQAGN